MVSLSAQTQTALFWDQLLERIHDGAVVPVVSKDLLTIQTDRGPDLLYAHLAARLADQLGVSSDGLSDDHELNDVACRYLSGGVDRPVQRIYAALKKVTIESETLPTPEPLLQLAAIRPFRLFVTTTFDSFLARALNEVRFEGGERTKVISYAPSSRDDLSGSIEPEDGPIVFHLLGKVAATPNKYAVTQWDLVDYFQALHSETRRPKVLFDELRNQSLLIIGSSFGGWLARFFLRMAKGQLGSGTQSADYIADPRLTLDSNLVLFLQHLNRETEIFYGGGAVEFVRELYNRWLSSGGDRAPLHREIARRSGTGAGPVFLSYASEDLTAANRLRAGLNDAGIDVFFSKTGLEAGDAWEPKLIRSIREASVFIPLISIHTRPSPDRRFFRKEWKLASEVAEMSSFSDENGFILPVRIDDTSSTAADVPEVFRSVQWQYLPGGRPSEDFLQRVQQLYRRYQKWFRGREGSP